MEEGQHTELLNQSKGEEWVLVMVEVMAKNEVEKFGLLNLEGWPAVVEDVLEDEDIVPI